MYSAPSLFINVSLPTMPRKLSEIVTSQLFSDSSQLVVMFPESDLPELCSSEFHRPFIFSSTHILIYIYHLLHTLLMSPFFSHFTTLPPSFIFLPAFSRFLNIRFPSPAFVSRRTFYMLTISFFLFPITILLYQLLKYHCCSHSFCSCLPSFPLFPSSPCVVKPAVAFWKCGQPAC